MTVKIELDHRHYGIHSPVRETEIPGEFADYAMPRALPNPDRDEYAVDEDRLLAALPDGFLPVAARSVLLMVADEDGGTALSGLSRFRPWAKYFDAYTLNICLPTPAPSPGTEDSP